MKDMVIKYLLLLSYIAIFSYANAESYSSIEELIAQQKIKKQKDVIKKDQAKLKKDKFGNYLLSWSFLSQYEPSKKSSTKHIKKVLNKSVVIKGFMIPLDYSAKSVKEFLLVPYIPTCSHVPPPPPNMTIQVRVDKSKKMEVTYFPLEVKGKFLLSKSKSTKKDQYALDGFFKLESEKIKEIK